VDIFSSKAAIPKVLVRTDTAPGGIVAHAVLIEWTIGGLAFPHILWPTATRQTVFPYRF